MIEGLTQILHAFSQFSMLACSLIWMVCCWFCWKVQKSTARRIELYESIVIETSGRLSQLEFKFLMAKINGENPITKEQQNDTSS